MAHRLSWILYSGSLQEELDILHKCDNPPCVRPDHLFTGTAEDNIHDCMRKGRKKYGRVYGELVGNHKLKASQVREMRDKYKNVRCGYTEIGKEYGITATTVGNILRGVIWKDDSDCVVVKRELKKFSIGRRVNRPLIEHPEDQSYRLIPLTQGQVASVDIEDYEWLMRWNWYAKWEKSSRSYYAVRNSRSGEGKPHTVRMHSQVMGVLYGDGRTVDHEKPSQTLNNRRSNLRIATKEEQSWNQEISIRNTSGFKGVSKYKDRNKWHSQIGVDGKKIHLISSNDPEVAYAAYCEAVKLYHGKFARVE